MGKSNPPPLPRQARVRRLDEVTVGFNKKLAQEESRRCPQCAVAECLPGCPLGIDIPGFIRLLREGDTTQALERIKKDNPFPAICGRICPAPCEDVCVLHAEGHAISIRSLERFASDFGLAKAQKIEPSDQAKKVAIIGSGPAGMSAAYYLAKAGCGVTIFEAAQEPGGLLRYAIAEFRLPQRVLNEQFTQLRLLGVQVQTGVILGRTMMIDELFMRGFSAVLLATGASLPRYSDLPGNDLSGVYYDIEFFYRLQQVNKDEAYLSARQQRIPLGKTVVLGSGAPAFDAARLSARLGSEVKVIFEGFEEQAGIDRETLKESKEEGIETLSMRVLELVGGENGFVQGVKCQKMDIVEDKHGLKLGPSLEGPVVLEAQTVIIANRHRCSEFLKDYLPQLKWGKDGCLWADDRTGMSSVDKVFACGSLSGAGSSVAEAIASGKTAAQKIHDYLK